MVYRGCDGRRLLELLFGRHVRILPSRSMGDRRLVLVLVVGATLVLLELGGLERATLT